MPMAFGVVRCGIGGMVERMGAGGGVELYGGGAREVGVNHRLRG